MRDALAASPDPARFGASIVASTMPFIPVIDGDTLPGHPLAAIAAGRSSAVPLLIGTNSDEFRTFLVPSGMAALVTDEVLASMAGAVGATPDVIAAYRASRPGASPGDLLAALLTDRFFLLPALAVAEARAGGPAATYFYEFAWRHPLVGAGHGLDVPFVFDNLTAEGARARRRTRRSAGPGRGRCTRRGPGSPPRRSWLGGVRREPPGPGVRCRRRQRQPRSAQRRAHGLATG